MKTVFTIPRKKLEFQLEPCIENKCTDFTRQMDSRQNQFFNPTLRISCTRKYNHTFIKQCKIVYLHYFSWKWLNIALTAIFTLTYLHNRVSACVTIVRSADNRSGQLAVTFFVSFNGSVLDSSTTMTALQVVTLFYIVIVWSHEQPKYSYRLG